MANNVLKTTWKEKVIAYFEVGFISWHLPGGTKEKRGKPQL
jgi:hypothetical protein